VPKPFSFGQLSRAVGRVFRPGHDGGWGLPAASGPVTQCPATHAAPQISFDLPDPVHSHFPMGISPPHSK
jgi:hypothetical protein